MQQIFMAQKSTYEHQRCHKFVKNISESWRGNNRYSVIYCNPLLKTGITITKLGVALIQFPATAKGT